MGYIRNKEQFNREIDRYIQGEDTPTRRNNMKDFVVSVQVIKTYNIAIKAESMTEAESKVNSMQSTDVEEQGSLKCTDVDYVEIIE